MVPATGPAAGLCFAQRNPRSHCNLSDFLRRGRANCYGPRRAADGAGADLNADAIAFATLTYAMDTSSVTGVAAAA